MRVKDVKKVVLAYSGGLDTSIILKWLQTEYGCEVITFTADLGQGEELLAVLAGEVRDRAHDALSPQDLVRERGDVAHVDARADDHAALRHRPERGRDQGSHRREDDPVHLPGWQVPRQLDRDPGRTGGVTVGADDLVQSVVGPIEEVVLPAKGREVRRGDPLFTLRPRGGMPGALRRRVAPLTDFIQQEPREGAP